MYYLSPIISITLFAYVHCGVLLWSTQPFRLPALKILTDDNLNDLITYLDNPRVVILKGDPHKYAKTLEQIIVDKYTAYVATEDLSLGDNVNDLNSDSLNDVNNLKPNQNVLCVIVNTDERFKRESEDDGDGGGGDSEVTETPPGPICYNADGKAMIYSSKSPILRMNSTTTILGKAIIASIDHRGTYTRLSVVVKTEGRKILLRFKFLWTASGYWTLKSVKIEDEDDHYTLFALTVMTASRNFSYHCTGETVFIDVNSDTSLILYDMQAQPDALDSIFGSAYDCVSFTTVPIWSGIFVTFILLIGLAFGLGAMDSIKAMDRFDNSKTKALTITVGE